MASGIPSRRRQISTTAAASSAVATEKRAATLRARSTNRVTAAESMPARDLQRGHQPQLLVGDPQPFAAGRQHPHRRRVRQDRLDQIALRRRRTCSQLSNTNNRTLPSNAAATLPATVLPGCWVMPSTAATASGTAAGSPTAASSKNQTPSGNSSASRAATSVARRVLPTPPTPVNVTNR